MAMLSIIIPALNEEKHLDQLLKSIKKQSFGDYEVIVADGGSADRTLEIAKSYGCRITSGGLPAKARNEGARISRGDLFIFFGCRHSSTGVFFRKKYRRFPKKEFGYSYFFSNAKNEQ